jgi:uncharacterized membrane protein
MNDAHFHLVVNHFPIILPMVGALILIIGLIAKSDAVKRTGFLMFILGAVSSIIAMTSGEGAEEIVENMGNIDGYFVHEHEEAAETFALLSYILGAFALIGMWASFAKKKFANIVTILVLIFAGVTLYFAQKAGTTGGEIRHTEIRPGQTPTAQPTDSQSEEEYED